MTSKSSTIEDDLDREFAEAIGEVDAVRRDELRSFETRLRAITDACLEEHRVALVDALKAAMEEAATAAAHACLKNLPRLVQRHSLHRVDE